MADVVQAMLCQYMVPLDPEIRDTVFHGRINHEKNTLPTGTWFPRRCFCTLGRTSDPG